MVPSSDQPLLSLEEAQRQILATSHPLPSEEILLEEALGRAPQDTIVARRTLPPWNNSAMDGYAVRAADLAALPASLRVSQTVYAGQFPSRPLGEGECARITTGAPLPPGADAVVMQERVTVNADGSVTFTQPVEAGALVRLKGEDTQAGRPLLEAGEPLGLIEAGLLWAQGLTRVKVPRRPNVAIFSNGDELQLPEGLSEQSLVDVNGPALSLAVSRLGAVPRYLGIARDSVTAIQALLERARGSDLILSSAGVSVGDHDHVKEAFARVGGTLEFWRVAIKPGKPLVLGRWEHRLFVGLPGNPVSALVTFELFVRPLLKRMLGHKAPLPRPVRGRAGEALEKPRGLTHLIRVRTEWRDGEWVAVPLPSQSSGALHSAAGATHLLVFPADSERIAAGDAVVLMPLPWQ